MHRNMIGLLFLDAPDSGSGGGADGGGGTPVAPASDSSSPNPIDVSDDTLIRVKGSDKPVKFNEYTRGFQSQFTKASQEAARLKQELARERDQRTRYEQERQRQQQQGSGGQPNGGQSDVYAQLEALPYLSGKDARSVVESIQGAINQRDQVLIATLKKLQTMEKVLNGLNENHSMQSFDSKISKWLTDGGYDQGYADLAKEIYLAYEGDDLDNEFPQIFSSRVKQVEDLIEARRQAKIQANKRPAFVPGKGGNTGPSKPLEIKPDASAKDIAEQLWGQWHENET